MVLEASGIRLTGPQTPVDLTLRDGEWLGLTGPSGCGKTTLLRTLAGLAEPDGGSVRVNGVSLSRLERGGLRRAIRLVPQQGVLFSGSVGDNIALGDPAASPEAVLNAARLAGLMPLLESLPDHLNTRVTPAGTLLSGGERQRLVLARAMLSRPAILLLDEATSALDAKAELGLLTALKRFLPRSAVVLVSHRRDSLALTRRVIHLGGGVETVAAGG
jgi:ABC-type bacteriocin/lantibiotic exporter with double-glycine peptidase domain